MMTVSPPAPAQRQAGTGRACAANDGNGAIHAVVHANSAASVSEETSAETDSAGSLIFIREYFVLRSAGMPNRQYQCLEILRTGVLARAGSGFTRDIFLHQRSP